jgi:hypothetical protein
LGGARAEGFWALPGETLGETWHVRAVGGLPGARAAPFVPLASPQSSDLNRLNRQRQVKTEKLTETINHGVRVLAKSSQITSSIQKTVNIGAERIKGTSSN